MWVVERLEPKLAEVGAHLALTGGVLYRGSSEKDLDLIIYPHTKSDLVWDVLPVKQLLTEFFGSIKIQDCEGVSQMRDDKEVSWLTTKNGKRVDFFFLS